MAKGFDKEMQDALRADAEKLSVLTGEDHSVEFFDFEDDPSDDYCPNCGGDGVVYSCFEEYACVDPESGCDLCERRCDWCRPSPTPTARTGD